MGRLTVDQFQTGLYGVRLHPVDDGLRADTGTGQLSRELGPTRQDGVEVSVRLSGEHSIDGQPQQIRAAGTQIFCPPTVRRRFG